MPQEKKYFGGPEGAGNFDDAFFAVPPNHWVNMENMRSLTTDAGETGTIESIGSTELIQNLLAIDPNAIEFGHAVDYENSRVVFCVWDPSGNHAIFLYDDNTGTISTLLLNAQVTGGLNFDKDHLIQSRVINGNYYFTDFLNEGRRFDIQAALAMQNPIAGVTAYANPVSQSVIAMARRQPGIPPIAVKNFSVSPANFIANQAMLFAWRYIYRGFEISTHSGYSNLVNFNQPADEFNYVTVSMSLSEKIDQDVIEVDLLCLFLITNQLFVVNSWLTRNPADATAIANHNSGSAALTYNFFNDRVGIALDDAYRDKEFDSIPQLFETIEFAKNRSNLGNYIIGYDTPVLTSLQVALQTGSAGGGPSGEWFFIKVESVCPGGGTPTVRSEYVIEVGHLSPPTINGYYKTGDAIPPFPPHINWADLTFVGGGVTDVRDSLTSPGCTGYITQFTDQSASSIVDDAPSDISLVGVRALKSDAPYQASITFYDLQMRKPGTLTNDTLKVLSPDRVYDLTSYTSGVRWTLSNVNAVNEIPDWGIYYSVDFTKCLRTRNFIQARSPNIFYAALDSSNNYTFTTTAFATTLAGIAVDISGLSSFGMGYQFAQGDLIKLWIVKVSDGSLQDEVTCSIIAQSGQWLVCQLQGVGTLGSTVKCLYEIYTPYQQQPDEAYLEMGKIYQVVNPGTPSRAYSIPSDVIPGDVTLVNRNDGSQDYLAEAMSPNDKYFKFWFTDAGRPNFIEPIGQVHKKDTVAFSNTFIPGSQTNGLSTFDDLDTKDIYPECGTLRKLQLTSKVEGQQGSIMLAICEQETASLYLGESQLLAAATSADVAISDAVIGTVNVLKGSFGTTHPESVYEFRGNVFWWSDKQGKAVQYSTNGLFPISNYKMTRFWKLFSEQFMSMMPSEIEAFGYRPYVFACVDPHNWELIFSIPQLLANPPKGYLPDYPDRPYPFDIWDGLAKSIVYKLNAEPNHWPGAYSHTPEGMVSVNNKLFGFKHGQMYRHNSITDYSLNIYGVGQKARIMCAANAVPNKPKTYTSFAPEVNMRPTLTYFRTEPSFASFEQYDLPEQASDLMDFDYTIKEGQLYSVIYRNKLQPTANGFNLNGLLTAERIRALSLLLMLEFTPTNAPVELRFINFGYEISAGHTT